MPLPALKPLLRSTRAYLPASLERMGLALYRNSRHALPIAWRRLRRERRIVIVATPHKVGSTWLFNLLRDLGAFEQRELPAPFMHLGTLVLDYPAVFTHLSRTSGHAIFKSHSFPPAYAVPPDLAEDVQFVTIYRDPRDVLVSASFYVATLPVERGGWGPSYQQLPPAERIATLIEEGDFLLTRLEAWFQSPIAYKVRYEDLLTDPARSLAALTRQLNLNTSAEDVQRVVTRHAFTSKTGRTRGEERPAAFLRKGIAGDWKNHFDAACRHAFKHAKEGRWNQLLVDMEYESSLHW